MPRDEYERLRALDDATRGLDQVVRERLEELLEELQALADVRRAARAPLEARPPARTRPPVWGFTPSSHALSVTRGDRRLVVVVRELPEGALTVAMECPRASDDETPLGDRTHRIVAQRTTLATGKRRGERFARDWLAGAPSARCSAADVTPKPKKKQPSR